MNCKNLAFSTKSGFHNSRLSFPCIFCQWPANQFHGYLKVTRQMPECYFWTILARAIVRLLVPKPRRYPRADRGKISSKSETLIDFQVPHELFSFALRDRLSIAEKFETRNKLLHDTTLSHWTRSARDFLSFQVALDLARAEKKISKSETWDVTKSTSWSSLRLALRLL